MTTIDHELLEKLEQQWAVLHEQEQSLLRTIIESGRRHEDIMEDYRRVVADKHEVLTQIKWVKDGKPDPK